MKLAKYATALTGLSSTRSLAQQTTGSEALEASSTAGQLLSVLLALGLIIALILALAWLVRKTGGGGFGGRSGPIKIIASLALGTRERVVVVEVGGQQLLLGVTNQQIRTLHVFDEPVVSGGERAEFGEKLMAAMKSSRAVAAKGKDGEVNREP